MKAINLITLGILIVGGLNRGMVSWTGGDVVSWLGGAATLPVRMVYPAFAFAALYPLLPLWLSFRTPERVVQADAF